MSDLNLVLAIGVVTVVALSALCLSAHERLRHIEHRLIGTIHQSQAWCPTRTKLLVCRHLETAKRVKALLELGNDWQPWGMFDAKTGHRWERIVIIRFEYSETERERVKNYIEELGLGLEPGRKIEYV